MRIKSTCSLYICVLAYIEWGTLWPSWLQHCGLRVRFPMVSGIFHWHNPSGRTMPLGLTQHLTEMSTRRITFGRGGVKVSGA